MKEKNESIRLLEEFDEAAREWGFFENEGGTERELGACERKYLAAKKALMKYLLKMEETLGKNQPRQDQPGLPPSH